MTKFAFVNILTLGRAPLVLCGCVCSLANLVRPSPCWIAAAVALLSLSALTDLFDGALARKWGVTSTFGALADPLMDKVFYLSTLPVATFVALWIEDPVHALVLLCLDVVCLARDQWVSFLRAVALPFGADVRASFSGKLRTFIGFPVIIFVHLWLGVETLAVSSPSHEGFFLCNRLYPVALEGVFLALTVWSGIDYTVRYRRFLVLAASHGQKG